MNTLTTFSEPIIYLIAFAIIFFETGILTFFFLPGDTLLFSLGIFAQQGVISIKLAILAVCVAGIAGNILGYYLGSFVRNKRDSSNLLQKVPEKYILKTEVYYKKYGSLTILFARFVPIVRTIAPFLAGVSYMNYKKYFSFSVIGAFLWAIAVPTFGYIFGKYVTLAHAETIAIGLMVLASVLTPAIVYLSKRYLKKG